MLLNIANVESLIFYDDKVWAEIPNLVRFRDQWRISKLSPSLRLTGKRAMSEFLDAAKGKYEPAISKRFGVPVTIDTIDSRTVVNVEFSSTEEFPDINTEGEYAGFALYREGERVFLTLWR